MIQENTKQYRYSKWRDKLLLLYEVIKPSRFSLLFYRLSKKAVGGKRERRETQREPERI